MMYPTHLLIVICLAFLFVVQSTYQQPLNLSLPTGVSYNGTVKSPPPVPYRVTIDRDLSMHVVWYGELAQQSMWNAIRINMENILQRIRNVSQFGRQNDTFDYFSSPVQISYEPVRHRGLPQVSDVDCLKIVNTI